jgi:hypothetical protein
MRAYEFLSEGGWDTKATQGTVIRPSTVKVALSVMQKLVNGLNNYLKEKNIPPIKIGAPTGSSAYHDVDDETKIYGDIDLQIVVPEIEQTAGKTNTQAQNIWYKLIDDYIKAAKPNYIHQDSGPGHPIVSIGKDQWVQIDLMPHPEKLATWGRYRVTPERGIKGLLMGNMFSVLGELLAMSIQHAGVQFKVRDKVKQPFVTTRKDYELITLSTNIETFVKDIFDHEAELQGIEDPVIDPMLSQYQGTDPKNIKIANLVNAVMGLAKSFEVNGMYGKGDLTNFSNSSDFITAFKNRYTEKAMIDIQGAKRNKAETPEAKARAEEDKKKIAQGLEMVMGLFK